MRAFLSLAPLLGLSLVLGASEGIQKPDKIDGTYRIVRGREEGKQVPKERVQDSTVVITKDHIRITDKDHHQTWLMRYTLNPGVSPKAITMTIVEGEGKGTTAEGIYQLEGDTLRLCYALPGHPRPKVFATRSGERELLFIMKRVPK